MAFLFRLQFPSLFFRRPNHVFKKQFDVVCVGIVGLFRFWVQNPRDKAVTPVASLQGVGGDGVGGIGWLQVQDAKNMAACLPVVAGNDSGAPRRMGHYPLKKVFRFSLPDH